MRLALFSRRKKPRQPNSKERTLLIRFANCELSLAQLTEGLSGRIEIDFDSDVRGLTSNFLPAEPGIRIGLNHIDRAKSRNSAGELSNEDLMNWATMILLNDAYVWDGPEEEEIADRLSELSLPQIFLKRSDKQ
jgi:hypothetical protein